MTDRNFAAVMPEPGRLRVEQVSYPRSGPHDAVVKVEAVGICGSDVAYHRTGRIGDYVVKGQIILGHEAAGTVVSVGSAVTDLAAGDRVAIEPGIACRGCPQCVAGRYHLCRDLVFLATPPHDGALVRYLGMPRRNLFRMPDQMTYEEGALVEPLSVGIWACRRARLAPGEDVLVTGAGPVGILTGLAARALGAGTVTVTDVSEVRLSVARTLGLRTESADRPGWEEFDVLAECSGAPGVLADGMRRLREAGRAAVVGIAKQEAVPLPLAALNPRELTISLVNRYVHTWPTAIELIASGRIDPKPLVTHRFSLAEAEAAFQVTGSAPEALKVVIRPHG